MGACLLHQAYTGDNPLFRPLGIRVNPTPAQPGARETIVVDEQVVIDRSPDELYRWWRVQETLRRIAPRLRDVQLLDDRHSRWMVEGPHGIPIEWHARAGNRLAHDASCRSHSLRKRDVL